MNDIDASLPELGRLLEQRLALLRTLADSLEFSTPALVENDVQAIARGAAHQAELCHQWSVLEEQLRRRRPQGSPAHDSVADFDFEHSARVKAEWKMVASRIRYLTRVHCSLLRHLQRSLAVLSRVVDSCAPTYVPDRGLLRTEARLLTAELASECIREHGGKAAGCAGE